MVTHAPFLHTTELENFGVICMRSLDASTYEVRCAVAKLLGALIAKTQIPVGEVCASSDSFLSIIVLNRMIRLHPAVGEKQGQLSLVAKNLWKMRWVFYNLASSRAPAPAS
jgi:hypothetical protein